MFFEPGDYARVRTLRNEGRLDEAYELLLQADPVPAVLDEIRKIASTRARNCRRAYDWEGVIAHLQSYLVYADKHRQFCIDLVNAEPPSHTPTDVALLQMAWQKVSESIS